LGRKKRGRDALEVSWDEGALASLDSRTQRDQYADLASRPEPSQKRR